MNSVQYIVGESQIVWEPLLDDDKAPITPTAVTANLYNMADNTVVATPTVIYEAGRMQVVLSGITTVGKYQLEWYVSYTDTREAVAAKTVYTDIIAVLRDATYLATLVPRLRPFVDDDPADPSYRSKTDDQWKRIIVETARHFMEDYGITQNASGQDDIDPEPTAGSDDEKIIVLRAAHFYYVYNAVAIASERTAMFQMSYDQAYAAVDRKINLLEEEIRKIDPNAAMPLRGETDIEAYGQMSDRLADALDTWNT